MPAPASRSADDLSFASPALVRTSGAGDDTAAHALPVPGACWRGKYDVIRTLGDSAEPEAWLGRHSEDGREVQIRIARPLEPEIRALAWAKLGGIDSPYLQRARDAMRVGDRRIEIADVVAGIPLSAWRAAHPAIDLRIVRTIVSQLAEAIAALHAFELVHLALRPEAIFIEDQGADLRCQISGLEALTSFERTEPIPAAVDPLYAPPEALGLNVHLPGPGMCAWDWWSLGRVVQEFALGRHVACLFTKPGSGQPGADLKSQAEALLMEADPKGPRAGAVELMRDHDPQLSVLLRGLLTSAKDARWTGDNVDRWVRGLPVKEHYATPRSDTHFIWRGRPCTVAEFAGILQAAEHWGETVVQLFEPSTPGTLAHFLRWSPSQSSACDQLTSALELTEVLPLKNSSVVAQRETVAMIALLQLSGGKLIWRGHPFDSATVPAILDELGEKDGLMVLRALTTRSTALQIERVDPAAGRLLTEVGRTSNEVEGFLRRNGWLGASDDAEAARILRLSADPIASLRGTRDALAEKYAGSDHPRMQKLFRDARTRADLVVIGWAASAPERCQFFTHAEANRRRAETLRARAIEILGALSWVRLGRALMTGRLVFGSWEAFLATAFFMGAAILVLWPGPIFAAAFFAPGLIAFGLRWLVAARQNRELRTYVPDAKWSWRDSPERCRRELRIAGRGVNAETLQNEFGNVTSELAGLKDVRPAPVELPPMPRFAGLRLAGILSWMLIAAFVAFAGRRAWTHRPSYAAVRAAWHPFRSVASAAEARVDARAAAGRGAVTKISWPYRAEDAAVKAVVLSTVPATSAQVAYAKAHGHDLVAPFRPETIGTLVILPVPSGDATAVMLYDGKNDAPYSDQVYVLAFAPIPRTWVDVGGHDGVFLDQ